MEILPHLKLSGIVQQHYLSESIKQSILDRLQHIPNIDSLKGTIQMVSSVANCVEELTRPNNRNSSEKVDKKQIALDVLTKLFGLNAIEVALAGKSIDYLIDAHLISRAGTLKKGMRKARNFLRSKAKKD
jgi:hypothetical protein